MKIRWGYTGKFLRMARQLARISQDKLGQALGVTAQSVSLWERGKARVPMNKTFEIVWLLGIDPEDYIDAVLLDMKCYLVKRLRVKEQGKH